MAKSYQVMKPPVSVWMYWPEGALLCLSFLTPFVAYRVWPGGPMFARAGSVMLLLSAIAEFTFLNRTNKKHLLNTCRAMEGETPWDFSTPAKVIGILSLVAALIGTFLWGYGDVVFRHAA